MKKITMLFNPTAGTGNHSAKELASSFSGKENRVNWHSTDDTGWEKALKEEPDLLVVAGGDGTVQKVANTLLQDEMDIPTRILPVGTANNMAKALHDLFTEISGAKSGPVQLDAGAISGVKCPEFFVESMGFGVFPKFVREIKEEKNKDSIKEDRQDLIKYFLRVVDECSPVKTSLTVDGIRIKGKFLLVQLFNIKFLGPNLPLAPEARPNDGYFDLLLVPAGRKEELKALLRALIDEKDPGPNLAQVGLFMKCKKLTVISGDSNFQVDDDIVTYSGEEIKVRIIPSRLTYHRNIT